MIEEYIFYRKPLCVHMYVFNLDKGHRGHKMHYHQKLMEKREAVICFTNMVMNGLSQGLPEARIIKCHLLGCPDQSISISVGLEVSRRSTE